MIGHFKGHADGSMLARVYGHLDKNVEFLKRTWTIERGEPARYHGGGPRRS